jgi:hypothetical protein
MVLSRSREAEIKLPAEAEITDCNSGYGSFLFIEDLKNFIEVILIAEDVFVNCYSLFNPLLG